MNGFFTAGPHLGITAGHLGRRQVGEYVQRECSVLLAPCMSVLKAECPHVSVLILKFSLFTETLEGINKQQQSESWLSFLSVLTPLTAWTPTSSRVTAAAKRQGTSPSRDTTQCGLIHSIFAFSIKPKDKHTFELSALLPPQCELALFECEEHTAACTFSLCDRRAESFLMLPAS